MRCLKTVRQRRASSGPNVARVAMGGGKVLWGGETHRDGCFHSICWPANRLYVALCCWTVDALGERCREMEMDAVC